MTNPDPVIRSAADAARSVAVREYCAKHRAVPTARIVELHAAGLTDAAAARELGVSRTTVTKYRAAFGLGPNLAAARAAHVAGAARGAAARIARAAARAAETAAELRLPVVVSNLGLRVVESLAAGPKTRPELESLLGVSAGRHSRLAKKLAELRRLGVLSRAPMSGRPRRSALPWSLAPATVAAAFSRDALAPLQQRLAAEPRHVTIAEQLAGAALRRVPFYLADEVRSAAFLGLAAAARTFDPANGSRFASYLHTRVNGEIMDALRASGLKGFRRDHAAAPCRVHAFDDGTDPTAAAAADVLPVGWEAESHDELAAILAAIPESLRVPVRLYYGHGLKMHEIGARLGVSQSRVSGLMKLALERLRRHYGEAA